MDGKQNRAQSKTQNHETSESDVEEEGTQHWLQKPRVIPGPESTIPHQSVTCGTQNHPQKIGLSLGETAPASERESIIED